jgi:hypothetical protein
MYVIVMVTTTIIKMLVTTFKSEELVRYSGVI